MARMFSRAVSELVDDDSESTDSTGDVQERFEESTYNKRIQSIKSAFGDKAINADSVVKTIRAA